MSKSTISTFEITKRFGTEKIAREHFEGRKWRAGIYCGFCGSTRKITPRKGREGYYHCADCRKTFTARTGTILERSHIGYKEWYMAMYILLTSRKGVSLRQFHSELGITQKSAWFLLHRLREACRATGNEKLAGIIEIDQTYIGGKELNKHRNKQIKTGRGAVGKAVVLGRGERSGRVKASHINKTDNATVRHSAGEYVKGIAHTNSIESVWAVLKHDYVDTYHNFSVKHLQRYVDSFAFRLNDDAVKAHMLDRIGALYDCLLGKRLTYKVLIK